MAQRKSVVQNAKRQQKQLDRELAAVLRQVVQGYGVAYSHLQGDVDALRLAIEALEEPTASQVKALPQYKRLLRNVEREFDKFTDYARTTIEAAVVATVGMGLAHAVENMKVLGVRRPASVAPRVLTPLLNYLRKEGPLYERLNLITAGQVELVKTSIIDGVLAGKNPITIAKGIEDAFGRGLTDAMRNTRTVQLWSYRDAARANYAANGVPMWRWEANLDDLTCEACIAQHGTVHPMDEQLDGHYNCRCYAVPYIEGATDEHETGEEYFNGLSADEQERILGPGKYEAWRDGKFEFSQLAVHKPNDVYGQMIGVPSLASLIGED